MTAHRERRATPRVFPAEAVEVVVCSPATGEPRYGRLLDASQGGLAFRSEEGFELGETLVVAVRALERSTLLETVSGRTVAVGGALGDQLVHVAFDARRPAAWLDGLAV
jgi:hypothetical protein